MSVQIKFTSNGCCTAAGVGNFSVGDTARVGAALAHHLVREAQCAVYGPEQEQTQQPEQVRVTKRGRAK